MTTSRRTSLISWAMVVCWMGVIFYLSNQPSFPQMPDPWLRLRKLAHVAEYLILTLLLCRALMPSARATRSPCLIATIISLSYAASDEYHQSFVLARTASALDVGIDTIGIITGVALFIAWRNRRQKPPKAALY